MPLAISNTLLGPLTAALGMQLRLTARPTQERAEWEALFASVAQPHLTQCWEYGQAKHSAEHWHVERLVLEHEGRPVALCQALERRLAGVRIATRINRGPLFLDPSPDFELRAAVFNLVRRRWRIGRGAPLLLAPALPDSIENRALLLALGFRQRKQEGWRSALIDLRPDEEEILARVAPVWRNRLRAAMKAGLHVRRNDAAAARRWMLDRHDENMRAKGFHKPTRRLLHDLLRDSPERFCVLQAMLGEEPVGGLILARFGAAAEYYVGWFGEQGRKVNCGNLLYWEAMREARRAGHRWFDLGGYYSDDKFGHFKQNLRGNEYRLAGEWISL